MNIVRRRNKLPRALATSVSVLLGLAAAAWANSATWIGGVSSDWADSSNWTDTFPNNASETATFDASGSSFTPTITSQTIQIGTVSFTAGAPAYTITLNGSTAATSLTFNSTGVDNSSGITQNFSASGGSGAQFVFKGTSTAGTDTSWTLGNGGVMQFDDTSSANGATVTIQSGGQMLFTGTSEGGTAIIVNESGGTFDISGRSGGVTVSSISGAGTFALGANTLTVGNSGDTEVSGVIKDGGASNGTGGGLTKVGTGTLTLSGVNTYTGTTTISDGKIALVGSGALSGSTTVSLSGATGIFDISGVSGSGQSIASLTGVAGSSVFLGAKTLTVSGGSYAGTISGTGVLSVTGAVTLTGVNTYTGVTNVDYFSSLTLSGDGSLADSTVVNLFSDRSTLDISGINAASETIGSLTGTGVDPANFIQKGSFVELGSKTLITGVDNTSTTFGGIISGSGGGLTKDGSGTMTLTGANTYTGTTTIAGGTLTLSAGGSLSDLSAVNISSATGIFNISGSNFTGEKVGSLAGVAGSSVVIGEKNLLAGGDNTSTAFAGVISGTGGLTKMGTGTMTLTGVNTYTGATSIIGGGTLKIDTVNTTASTTVISTSSKLVMSGGIFQLTGLAGASRTQVVNGLYLNGGQNSVVIDNNFGTITTLDIRSTDTDNPLTISRGAGATVDFRALNGTLGTDAIIKTAETNDATGIIGSWATVNNGAGFASVDSSGNIIAFDNYHSIDALGPNTVPNGADFHVRIDTLGTSGPVALSQPTTIINTLSQNFTTASTIDTSSGVLKLGVAGGIFINAGKADLTIGTAVGSGTVTAGGTSTNVAANLTLGNYSSSTLTMNSVMTDNGSGVVNVIKTGSGLLNVTAANTYSGATVIAEGKLALIGAGTVGSIGRVNLSGAAGIFDFSAMTPTGLTLNSLAGVANSSVVLGAKNLTINGDLATTFDGDISGSGALTKTGTGSLTLGGNSSYTGGTTLAGGTLITNSSAALGSSAGVLSITGTSGAVTLGSSVEGVTLPNKISVLTNFSVGTTAVNYTLSGVVDLNGSTREITGFNASNQIHFAGGITNGSLTLKTTLTGDGQYVAFIMDENNVNTYTGLTTVDNGAFLVLEGSTANGAVKGNVLIQGNGVVDYLGGAGEQIVDTATVTVNSTGNSASGGLFMGLDLYNAGGGGGTESIGSLFGTGTVGLANGKLSVASGSFSGVISDGLHKTSSGALVGGSLEKRASGDADGGTLILSNENTYTGATTITGGTLKLTGAGSLGDKTAVKLFNAGIFDISGITAASERVGSLQSDPNNTTTSQVKLGTKTLIVGGNSPSTDSLKFDGVISGAGGGLTKEGVGTLTLTGVNTYTGSTSVNLGTLVVDTTTNAGVIDSASKLEVGGGTFQLSGKLTTDRTLVMNGLTVNAGSSVILVNNLTAANETKLDLRGTGTAGITRASGGTVDFRAGSGATNTFGANATVYTKPVTVAGSMIGAWATVNGGAAFASTDATGKIVAYTGYTSLNALGPNLLEDGPDLNYRIDALGASGSVRIEQTRTDINTLTQNFTTASTIDTSPGYLRLGKEGGIFITPTGASLTIGTVPNEGHVTAGGNVNNQAGDLILGNFSTAGDLTINAAVIDNGTGVVSLTTTGAGKVILAGTNTYTGATTIGGGTLALTGMGSLLDTNAVTIANKDAIFDISGITATGETIGSLTGVTGSKVVLGAKTLTVGGNNSSTTFAGVISGTGGLTKLGTGTMTLTGQNTFTGATTVTAGTLILNATGGNAITGNLVANGGDVIVSLDNQIASSATMTISEGSSVTLGVYNLSLQGVTLIDGLIDGSSGVLTSATSFDVRSGTINVDLASSADTAGLTKTTDGTVILNGTNSYAGQTNVNGGVLILNGVINGGEKGVVVTNTGSEFDVGVNGAVVVAVDGVDVVKANAGTFVNNAGLIKGANNASGIAATTDAKITNSGAIVGGAVGFKGVSMSGGGNSLQNSGFITADKAIVTTNATGKNEVVNYGTLTGNSGTAIDGTGSAGSLSVINVGVINGDIKFGSGDDMMTLVAKIPVAGLIDGGTGTNTLRILGSASDTLNIGDTTVVNHFSRLYKTGGGTWTLTGNGTYKDGTIVNMGTLSVQGNLTSDVLVLESGILGGRGIISGNVTNFGTVSPGNSPGTLTVKGDYQQSGKGTLTIQIAGKNAGEFDWLKVGGQARLGGTLQLVRVDRAPRLKIGEKITFLTAAGGVDGKFKKVSNAFEDTGTMVTTKLVYDAHSVSLEGAQGSFVEFAEQRGLTPNQKATARVVDAAADAGKNEKMFDYLNKRKLDKIPADLDRIAPEELTAAYRLGVGLASVQSQNIQRRTDDIRLSNRRVNTAGFQATGAGPGYSGPIGDGGVVGPEGPVAKTVRPEDQKWGAFLNGMAEWIKIGDTENARGYDLNTGGVTVGADYKVNDNFAVGVSAGYAGTSAALAQGGKMQVNGGKVGVYATYYDGGYYVDAAVSGGYNSYDMKRAGLEGPARGKTDGGEFNAMLGGGYDWSLEALTLGALTSVEYTYLGIGDYTERGSLAPLNIAGQSAQSLRSKLGVKASYDWQWGNVLLKPEIRLLWQHEYGDRSYDLDSRLASGAGGIFTVTDPAVARDSLLLGLGTSVLWNPRTAAYLFYDGELYRKESESHNISGGVRISF